MTIGSGATCDVRIIDPEMAQTHAEIAHRPGGPTLHDLGSMNRILLNNHEVRQAVIKHGDLLELGRTRFLVQVYVQAEVKAGGEEEEPRRKWWPVAVGASVILLMLLLVPPIHRWRHPVPQPPAPVPTPAPRIKVSPVVPVVGRSVLPPVIAGLTTPSNGASQVIKPPATGAVRVVSASNAVPATSTAVVATAVAPTLHGGDTERAAQDAELTQAATALAESKARALLAQVKDRVVQGDLDEAERLLTEIFWFQPEFPPALEERARLLERRGRLNEARQQWAALAATTNTEAAALALSEVRRIDAVREAARPPAPVKLVRIESAELSKFPTTEAFREMRLLAVRLTPIADLLPEPGEVKVEFVFYERDPVTGLVAPAPDRGPREALVADGAWHAGEAKVVSASYTVPASTSTNQPAAFHGYVVRVFNHGVLQDATAQPRDLLPTPATSGPSAVPRAPAGSSGAG